MFKWRSGVSGVAQEVGNLTPGTPAIRALSRNNENQASIDIVFI